MSAGAGGAPTAAASRWQLFWFGPVAAVRPFVFLRGLLFVLAADLFMTRLEPASGYGLGGLEVPHFDAFDPAAAGAFPDLYIACVLLAGLAALIAALTGSRAALVVLFIFYTASWSMSMRDLFQHHYFLSILLAGSLFLPWVSLADFAGPAAGIRAAPRCAAPAFALIGVSVAIVYAFAAVAKLDSDWQTGGTLQALGVRVLIAPALEILATLGVSEARAFRVFGAIAVVLESFLAFGYLAAPLRDRSGGSWRAAAWTLVFVLAAALHLGFEVMGLKIGWFSGYMVGLAAVFFLPERLLLAAVAKPGRALSSLLERIDRIEVRSSGWVWAVACPAAALASAAANAIDLPGSAAVGAMLAVVILCVPLWPGRSTRSQRTRTAVLLAACGLVMAMVVSSTEARFSFYSVRVEERLKAGELVAARADFAKLERYARQRVPMLVRLGEVAARLGEDRAAARYYRAVLSLDGENSTAVANLAWLLATAGSPSSADARQALALAVRAAEATRYRDPNVLDTLAAAHAANAAFVSASATARRGLALAEAQGLTGLMNGIRGRLELYDRGERWTR